TVQKKAEIGAPRGSPGGASTDRGAVCPGPGPRGRKGRGGRGPFRLNSFKKKKSGGAVPVGVTGSGTLGGGAAALAATAHRVGGSKPAAFQRSAMAGPVSAAMKARAAAGSVLLAGIAAA